MRVRGPRARLAKPGGGVIVDASGSRKQYLPWKGKKVIPMSARTVHAAPAIGARVVATAASYVVIYGVTFAFFAPPATHLAGKGFVGYDATTSSFTLLLLAALTVTIGAVLFSAAVGYRVEHELQAERMSKHKALMEFAAPGLLMSLATAGIFVGVVGSDHGVTGSLVGAATLGLLIPGVVAALFTRSVVDHVAAAKREIVATTVSAIAVIGLTNYLIVGSLPSVADLPQLFGL